jgi:RNA polymerase sigma-70 factor (ECF subfamily)
MIGVTAIGSRLRRRRGHEEVALRAAYAAHGRELYGLALRSLGDRGLAEEIVQDTFVRAWRGRERFDAERGSLRTWLFAIARNLIIDAARARASRPPARQPSAENERDQTETDEVEKTLLSMQIQEALRRLSEEHRTVILEVQYRGRPYAEVAKELGVPAATLRSRMYYGLKALRLALEEMGWSDE